jgi:hypothetical protein
MRKRLFALGVALLLWLVSVFQLGLSAFKAVQGRLNETVAGALFVNGTWQDRIAPVMILIVSGFVLLGLLLNANRLRREASLLSDLQGWSTQRLRNLPSGFRVYLVRNRAVHIATPRLDSTTTRRARRTSLTSSRERRQDAGQMPTRRGEHAAQTRR